MSDPPYPTWNPPPVPAQGDLDENSIYAGVGRVLSMWELIELELSRIFGFFRGNSQAYREYGQGRIFVERIRILRDAATLHFVSNCDQVREAEFDRLGECVEKFSNRRNDVAHSIVREIGFIRQRRVGDTAGAAYLLVPPHYDARRFGPDHLPRYAYRAVELQYLISGLSALQDALAAYRSAIRAGPQT
jgi:hypothetical protein